MDFSLSEGTTIIGYSGISNNVKAYEIVDFVTEELGAEAVYITNLPAGGLLSGDTRVALEKTITDYITYNKEATSMIMSGCDNTKRVGPNCGYGNYLSLDDFVSAKLMGESTGVSENVIIFCPGDTTKSPRENHCKNNTSMIQ